MGYGGNGALWERSGPPPTTFADSAKGDEHHQISDKLWERQERRELLWLAPQQTNFTGTDPNGVQDIYNCLWENIGYVFWAVTASACYNFMTSRQLYYR